MPCGMQFLVICLNVWEAHLGKTCLFSDRATYFQIGRFMPWRDLHAWAALRPQGLWLLRNQLIVVKHSAYQGHTKPQGLHEHW